MFVPQQQENIGTWTTLVTYFDRDDVNTTAFNWASVENLMFERQGVWAPFDPSPNTAVYTVRNFEFRRAMKPSASARGHAEAELHCIHR